MKNAAVMVGKSPWSKIEIEALVEFANLAERLAAFGFLFKDSAAPRAVIASARSFGELDDVDCVICLHELVSGSESADTGAEYHYRLSGSGSGCKLRRTCPC